MYVLFVERKLIKRSHPVSLPMINMENIEGCSKRRD